VDTQAGGTNAINAGAFAGIGVQVAKGTFGAGGLVATVDAITEGVGAGLGTEVLAVLAIGAIEFVVVIVAGCETVVTSGGAAKAHTAKGATVVATAGFAGSQGAVFKEYGLVGADVEAESEGIHAVDVFGAVAVFVALGKTYVAANVYAGFFEAGVLHAVGIGVALSGAPTPRVFGYNSRIGDAEGVDRAILNSGFGVAFHVPHGNIRATLEGGSGIAQVGGGNALVANGAGGVIGGAGRLTDFAVLFGLFVATDFAVSAVIVAGAGSTGNLYAGVVVTNHTSGSVAGGVATDFFRIRIGGIFFEFGGDFGFIAINNDVIFVAVRGVAVGDIAIGRIVIAAAANGCDRQDECETHHENQKKVQFTLHKFSSLTGLQKKNTLTIKVSFKDRLPC